MDKNDKLGKGNTTEPKSAPAQRLHDLNNLFAALTGGLQVLGMMHKDNERSQRVLVNAETSAARIREMVTEMVEGEKASAREAYVASRIEGMTDADRFGLFFSAIDMTRMPMIVTDPNQPDNPVIFANQAFLNTTGYEMEEVVGRNCRFLQGPETDRDKITQVKRAIEQKTDVFVEVQNYRKDGSLFWNALFISPIFNPEGKLQFFFGSQLDVTRRREAESALRRAQKMEAIGQLTGGIAHDFNNLLQVIIGNVQLARTGSESPDKLHRHLDAILNGAQKAKSLTQHLLAFSRQQALETRVVNLNRVIEDLEQLLSKTLGPRIQLRLDLANDLANAEIDVIQLEMALINILANARDAMPDGGVVQVSTRNVPASPSHPTSFHSRAGVEITIRDEGEGMSPAVLAHITEPFFTTKEVGKGTGLGLAQVYGFVQQSNGLFNVESKEGEGTTINLTFPADTTQLLSADKSADDPNILSGKGECILVVEDNKEVRELACTILEAQGYRIIEAETAAHGLALFMANPKGFDMLFTDIIMPGQMNGVALAKEVRKQRPDVAVLITTGFAQDIHGHTNSSEFETLYKPYMPDELSEKVRDILNRKLDHRA